MYKYYEVKGMIDGKYEVLYGSYDKSDCDYELDAEKEYWREDGYKGLCVSLRLTDEAPDPTVYS